MDELKLVLAESIGKEKFKELFMKAVDNIKQRT